MAHFLKKMLYTFWLESKKIILLLWMHPLSMQIAAVKMYSQNYLTKYIKFFSWIWWFCLSCDYHVALYQLLSRTNSPKFWIILSAIKWTIFQHWFSSFWTIFFQKKWMKVKPISNFDSSILAKSTCRDYFHLKAFMST